MFSLKSPGRPGAFRVKKQGPGRWPYLHGIAPIRRRKGFNLEKWFERRQPGDYQALGRKYGIDPLTARILRNRGARDDEEIRRFLYGNLDDLDDPRELTGIEKAVEIIAAKIKGQKSIRIIGDYDIDGVCATYILVKGLTALGGIISYDIPERLQDGYGLNIRLVKEAVDAGIDTLITVDNGISAASQIKLAKDSNMTVIVTDHHEPPYEEKDGIKTFRIPRADAVVDPSLDGCPYPNKALCGAGVAWKLLYLLEAEMSGRRGSFGLPPLTSCPLTMNLLPFAAFATVGDVMDLRGENHILVRYGLEMLPNTDNTGMQALIDACGLRGKRLSAYHIGFVLGPCINAGGRLKTAKDAEELFLTDDGQKARILAHRLTELNLERRTLTDTGLAQAMVQLQKSSLGNDRVLVLYLPGTHESIVGIIAGKVREKTGKPTFILTDAQEEGMLKGSGRSIEEYSMFDELVKCSSLLSKFGGHPMAAGLSLRRENLVSFREKLNEVCTLTEDDIARKVMLDARLPIGYITETLVEDLKRLEPFGKGNERPLFGEPALSLESCRIMGERKNAAKLTVSSGGVRMTALYFGDIPAFLDDLKAKAGEEEVEKLMAGRPNRVSIMAAFYPDINEFRGNHELQIHITNYR